MKTNYLKNYKKSDFLIKSVDLTFEIESQKTTVTSILTIINTQQTDTLSLNGQNQELIVVELNNRPLAPSEYQLTPEHLKLIVPAGELTLKIVTQIQPEKNRALMGLYQSGTLLCTQCEPEGFRNITYYLDRPDIMAVFTTTIIADKTTYPVLLANGNCIKTETLDNNRHLVSWHDPFKKPPHLFAMVAGDLGMIEDHFETQSGRKVLLRIYTDRGQESQCHHAMASLKKSMKWDETVYGCEYDLDIYMIVAVSHFNFGAMENKGLNIFNAKYILADQKTATDTDYFNIDRVVGHEYFHNWSGNRVGLRDWFQICLKEGLTSFREQAFCSDITGSAVTRIDEVNFLRDKQFPEDAGPLAHPIRPESYIDIENFYTMTVYQKGAEVIRLLKNIVGNHDYYQGVTHYFNTFDGKTATCEDFLASLEQVSGMDLSQFRLWYSQAGTPELFIESAYNHHTLTLTIRQKTTGEPQLIPFKFGLIDQDGYEITDKTLLLTQQEESFQFPNLERKPLISMLRDFSAPVKVHYHYTAKELKALIASDKNGFSKWEAMQILLTREMLDALRRSNDELKTTPFSHAIEAIRTVLTQTDDLALTARLITLPTEKHLLTHTFNKGDIEKIHVVRETLRKHIATELKDLLRSSYQRLNHQKPYRYHPEEIAKRALKNSCLDYLSIQETQTAFEQFTQSDNMTDQLAALQALSGDHSQDYQKALAQFYNTYQNNPLVIDKWFTIQALSSAPHTLEQVKILTHHNDFILTNPNRVRALLGAFSQNQIAFHDLSGDGYQLITDYIIKLDAINPMLATRLIEPLTLWKTLGEKRKALMYQQLKRIQNEITPSKTLYEIIEKTLAF